MAAVEAPTKTCRKCGETKPLDEFHRNRKSRDGHQSRCKPCMIEAASEWQAKNRQQATDNQRRRRQANPALALRDLAQAEAYRTAESRLREAHRDEFDRLYDEELRERGLR